MDEFGKKDSTCHQRRQWLNYNCENTLPPKAVKYLSLCERKKILELAFNNSSICRQVSSDKEEINSSFPRNDKLVPAIYIP
jgi:hypothetical protein